VTFVFSSLVHAKPNNETAAIIINASVRFMLPAFSFDALPGKWALVPMRTRRPVLDLATGVP
jgi:hypothetical protein